MTPKHFNETNYENISVALQFSAKKKKATVADKQSAQIQFASTAAGSKGGPGGGMP